MATYEVVTQVVEVEEVPEKMPESPWHSELVDAVKGQLQMVISSEPEAKVIRDIYFQYGGKRYAPDLAVVLKGAPPVDKLGMIYRVPEDGPAPDLVVEVAVSDKALGEALGGKARFYAEMGVKEYLVIEAPVNAPINLWFCKPALVERPKPVAEARLETLSVVVRAEGQKVRVFDFTGSEILPPMEALERERAKREELERKIAELEQKLAQGSKCSGE